MKQRADAVTNIAPEVGEMNGTVPAGWSRLVECRVQTVKRLSAGARLEERMSVAVCADAVSVGSREPEPLVIETSAALFAVEVVEVLRGLFQDLWLARGQERRQLLAYSPWRKSMAAQPTGSNPVTQRKAVSSACQSLRCAIRTLRPAGVSR